MSELGNRVRAARAYAGAMTQDELAAKLPFSLSTLQRVEAGGRALSELEEPAFAEAVGKATGLPPWFFVSDFERVAAGPSPIDDESTLARVEEQVRSLKAQLREMGSDAHRELEKQARSHSHDRGRLGRIEKDLGRLTALMLEHVDGEKGAEG